MPFSWHSAFAKFRSGVGPLRLETGRYENLAVNQRTCFNCREFVESEKQVLLHCPLYEDLQYEMFMKHHRLILSLTYLTMMRNLYICFPLQISLQSLPKPAKTF